MAEAARARAEPLPRSLPDEIIIWEILLRLPPKDLLRCRAVCWGWRRATSTRDFLLTHHLRQPSLPLLFERSSNTDGGGVFLDIMPLDHSAGVAAADQLQSVARVASRDRDSFMHIDASCDGLLIVCTVTGDSYSSKDRYYSVCNPATRQYAPLPLLRGFLVAGMYPHPPTGEYRLLLYKTDDEPPPDNYDSYVYALGSREPPRYIGWPHADDVIQALHPVRFRGDLHWFVEHDETNICVIAVFDTTAEMYRQMRAPPVLGIVELFEMDAMLGLASFSLEETTIEIWTTRDYDSQEWAFKCWVELPIAELTVRFGYKEDSDMTVLSSWDDDDDVLILVQSGEWLLQIGMDGKLVASFHRELLGTTEFRLKQSLVPQTFFPAIEGYVVNAWPFI